MNTATKVGTSKYSKKIIDTTKKQGNEYSKPAGKILISYKNRIPKDYKFIRQYTRLSS